MSQNENWIPLDAGLYRKLVFKDFLEAYSFITKVAFLAEKYQHHPTWKNTYNAVEIWLVTHDDGNKITEKDYKLAQAIDECL